MNRKGKSLFIPSTGPQADALEKGFDWLFRTAQKSGNYGFVAVWAKVILNHIARWNESFAPILTELSQCGRVTAEGINIDLFVSTDRIPQKWNGPILVIYGGQKLLDIVDGIPGKSSVLYIPWEEKDHVDWVQTWGATPLGQRRKKQTKILEPTSGPAFFALKSLTNSVNLNTGIIDPSDYEEAVQTLETLFHKGSSVSPETIRQQLIRLNWKPAHAGDVKTLAMKIWEGRRPKSSKGRPNESLWNFWVECAEKEEKTQNP